MKFPLRRVVEITWHHGIYCKPGHGSNQFKLECGHTTWAKGSAGTPKFKRCRECGLLLATVCAKI